MCTHMDCGDVPMVIANVRRLPRRHESQESSEDIVDTTAGTPLRPDPSPASPIYLAVKKVCPQQADSHISQLSEEGAVAHVNFLLYMFRQCALDINGTDSLDVVVAQILDTKDLVKSKLVDGDLLVRWLYESHVRTPLYRVIHRLLQVIEDGDHLSRCLCSVGSNMECMDDQDYQTSDRLCFSVLTLLLHKLDKFHGNQPFSNIVNVLGLHRSLPGEQVLRCVAEIVRTWPRTSVEMQEAAKRAVLDHAVYVQCGQAAVAMESFRRWVQLGLAVRPAASGGFTDSPALASLLQLMLCERRKKTLRCFVTWALWLTSAGARPIDLGNINHRQLFHEVRLLVPDVRHALLLRSLSLQEMCVRVIRHHLQGLVTDCSRSLPLPSKLQERVANGYMEVHEQEAYWLTECILKGRFSPSKKDGME